MFTGASQFALVGVLASGGAPLSGPLSGLLLGTRNTLYGLRLAPLLGWRGARRVAAAHLVIDESTAMAMTRTTREARPGRLPVHRAVGVRAVEPRHPGRARWPATALGDPRTYGLDAAVGGAFLALLWPRLDSARNRVVARARGGRRARPGAAHPGRRPGARRRRRRARASA